MSDALSEVFHPEGKLYEWALKIYEILVLHMLFLIASIPLVTIGASTTALYATWFKIWDGTDEGKLVRTFFAKFRSNFVKSSVVWLAMVVIAAACILLVYPFAIVRVVQAFPPLSFAVILVVAAVALTSGYIFPILARFENTLRRTISNSFLLAMSNMAVSVIVFMINGAVLALGFVISGRLVIVWLFGSFGVASFCNSWILNRVFAKYIPAENLPTSPGDQSCSGMLVSTRSSSSRSASLSGRVIRSSGTE